MSATISEIKSNSRNLLMNDNWGTAIAAVVLALSVLVLSSFINSFSDYIDSTALTSLFSFLSFVLLLFLSPMFLGVYRLFMVFSLDTKPSLYEVFYFFSGGRYLKAIAFNIVYFLRSLLVFLVFSLPGAVVYYLVDIKSSVLPSQYLFEIEIASYVLFGIGLIFALLCFIRRLYLVGFLYITAADGAFPWYVFKNSRTLMKGNTFKVFTLNLSLLPWILSLFFAIPVFYAAPYIAMANASCSKDIVLQSRDTKEAE